MSSDPSGAGVGTSTTGIGRFMPSCYLTSLLSYGRSFLILCRLGTGDTKLADMSLVYPVFILLISDYLGGLNEPNLKSEFSSPYLTLALFSIGTKVISLGI